MDTLYRYLENPKCLPQGTYSIEWVNTVVPLLYHPWGKEIWSYSRGGLWRGWPHIGGWLYMHELMNLSDSNSLSTNQNQAFICQTIIFKHLNFQKYFAVDQSDLSIFRITNQNHVFEFWNPSVRVLHNRGQMCWTSVALDTLRTKTCIGEVGEPNRIKAFFYWPIRVQHLDLKFKFWCSSLEGGCVDHLSPWIHRGQRHALGRLMNQSD